MKKEEIINRYGEEAYKKMQEQSQEWARTHKEVRNKSNQAWTLANLEKVRKYQREQSRKGGKYHEKNSKYNSTGLRRNRCRVRQNHTQRYRPYKKIIAPNSQIHHQWLPDSAEYTGVALVEKDQHQHGYIDVIQILEGEITLLTEAEIRGVVR